MSNGKNESIRSQGLQYDKHKIHTPSNEFGRTNKSLLHSKLVTQAAGWRRFL
jgi:hypothetical protein